MLDWILNPFGVDLGAYVILWIGLVIILVGSAVATLIKVFVGRRW